MFNRPPSGSAGAQQQPQPHSHLHHSHHHHHGRPTAPAAANSAANPSGAGGGGGGINATAGGVTDFSPFGAAGAYYASSSYGAQTPGGAASATTAGGATHRDHVAASGHTHHLHAHHGAHHHHAPRDLSVASGVTAAAGTNAVSAGGQGQVQGGAIASQREPTPLGGGVAVTPRVPLAERDVFMLSLPSQDHPSYYDPPQSDDDDAPSPTSSPAPITNRGNKLHPSAPFIRRGRLGAYPSTDAGFSAPLTKRQRILSGHLPPSSGLAIAPNLHLLNSSYAEENPEPVLPPPPSTPLDLVCATEIQRTLGPRNTVFRTLGMSATGLIEQEGPLVNSLSRVCAGLRGEGFSWRSDEDDDEVEGGAVGDAGQASEGEGEEQGEGAVNGDGEGVEETTVDAAKGTNGVSVVQSTEASARSTPAPAAGTPAAEGLAPGAVDLKKGSDEEGEAKKDASAELKANDGTLVGGTQDVEMEKVKPEEDDSANGAPKAEQPTAPGAVSTLDVGATTDIDASAGTPLSAVPDLVAQDAATTASGAPTEAGDDDVDMAAGDDESFEEPLRRRSGRVASRANDSRRHRSNSASSASSRSSSTAPIARPKRGREPAEETPEFAKRLVDPEVYVRSLFVSSETVELDVQIAGPPGQQPQMGIDAFSPNEQEVMVHDCLTDLHRFLADSLEYRNRLAEIRDGVLGVERRRKGMWRTLRIAVENGWVDAGEE